MISIFSMLSQAFCCAGVASAPPPKTHSNKLAHVAVVAQAGLERQSELPKMADAFVDAVGVDTEFNYTGTPYDLEWPTVSANLIDLGVRHIRDGGTPTPAYMARLSTLGQHGIKHAASFLTNATPAAIKKRLETFAPYVDFVEPQNEYDGNRNTDPDWVDHIVGEQRTLYDAVHNDPAFAGITVLGPALARANLYASLGSLDQYEDDGNIHWAPCDRHPGTQDMYAIPRIHAMARASTQSKPIWTTETGYSDNMARPCGIEDDVIAKYDPRTVTERWNAGEPRIYFYEFTDVPRDKVFGALGLLRADGSQKPQYVALRSMLHLLADPGTAFSPTPLQFALGGDTQDVHHTLLQKRDGRYELLLWLEVSGWDPKSHTRIAVRPQTVTLSLPGTIRTGRIHTYTPSWSLTSKPLPLHNGEAQINVSDAISFVELSP